MPSPTGPGRESRHGRVRPSSSRALAALVCVVCVPDFNLSGIATTIGLGALRAARVGNTRVVWPYG